MITNCDSEENPFVNLKISEKWKTLHTLDNRSHCSKCLKSRKYFCYTCFIPVAEIKDDVPIVKLPVKVDIIKHCREIDGKSTAAHAAVIAPSDVSIYTYPYIPEYEDGEKVVLVYPNKDALTVGELIEKSTKNKCQPYGKIPFTRVIFIDSTWNQSKGIYKDSRLKSLPCIILKTRVSQFWRHQKDKPRWHLATIEAIHQFFIELHYTISNINQVNDMGPKQEQCDNNYLDANKTSDKSVENSEAICSNIATGYKGEYDNLLFFFRFMYDKIHTLYDHDTLRSYKRPLK